MVNNAVWKTFLIRIFGHPVLIRRIQTPVILRLLNVHSDETVLDAGCGQGFFTNELAKKSKLSVGIDLSLNNRFLYHKQQRVACIRGDIQKLPFG
ncbi:MAG: class I SAM-dependent methyltransferase, partial [Candidatus Bathyarchaeota archaeon]|nr:class I SAM-dependent methyltransferase [Candidatus Bathyarchaeota archaeon]